MYKTVFFDEDEETQQTRYWSSKDGKLILDIYCSKGAYPDFYFIYNVFDSNDRIKVSYEVNEPDDRYSDAYWNIDVTYYYCFTDKTVLKSQFQIFMSTDFKITKRTLERFELRNLDDMHIFYGKRPKFLQKYWDEKKTGKNQYYDDKVLQDFIEIDPTKHGEPIDIIRHEYTKIECNEIFKSKLLKFDQLIFYIQKIFIDSASHYYQASTTEAYPMHGSDEKPVFDSEMQKSALNHLPSNIAQDKGELLLPEDLRMQLCSIHPGTFLMGSPEDEKWRRVDETLHPVTLTTNFWIGRYKVTQEQYESVMGVNPSFWKGSRLPVEHISWNDAMAFCRKLNELYAEIIPKGYWFTLPTEAQWEYACRAGTNTQLNNGTDLTDKWECSRLDELGWYVGNSNEETHPVGQKKPNAWGLYDMHGNVAEFCLDSYSPYPTCSMFDPYCSEAGLDCVTRGSTCLMYAKHCRAARRCHHSREEKELVVGFRLAISRILIC